MGLWEDFKNEMASIGDSEIGRFNDFMASTTRVGTDITSGHFGSLLGDVPSMLGHMAGATAGNAVAGLGASADQLGRIGNATFVAGQGAIDSIPEPTGSDFGSGLLKGFEEGMKGLVGLRTPRAFIDSVANGTAPGGPGTDLNDNLGADKNVGGFAANPGKLWKDSFLAKTTFGQYQASALKKLDTGETRNTMDPKTMDQMYEGSTVNGKKIEAKDQSGMFYSGALDLTIDFTVNPSNVFGLAAGKAIKIVRGTRGITDLNKVNSMLTAELGPDLKAEVPTGLSGSWVPDAVKQTLGMDSTTSFGHKLLDGSSAPSLEANFFGQNTNHATGLLGYAAMRGSRPAFIELMQRDSQLADNIAYHVEQHANLIDELSAANEANLKVGLATAQPADAAVFGPAVNPVTQLLKDANFHDNLINQLKTEQGPIADLVKGLRIDNPGTNAAFMTTVGGVTKAVDTTAGDFVGNKITHVMERDPGTMGPARWEGQAYAKAARVLRYADDVNANSTAVLHPSGRVYHILDALKGPANSAARFIHGDGVTTKFYRLDDLESQDFVDEVQANLREALSKSLANNYDLRLGDKMVNARTYVRDISNAAIGLKTAAEKHQFVIKMEDELLQLKTAEKNYGLEDSAKRITVEQMRAIGDQYSKSRDKVMGQLGEKSYIKDPTTGDIIVMTDHMRDSLKAVQGDKAKFLGQDQLAQALPAMNWNAIDKATLIHGAGRAGQAANMAIAGGFKAADLFYTVWRPAVLLRIGYPVRNVGEGVARMLFQDLGQTLNGWADSFGEALQDPAQNGAHTVRAAWLGARGGALRRKGVDAQFRKVAIDVTDARATAVKISKEVTGHNGRMDEITRQLSKQTAEDLTAGWKPRGLEAEKIGADAAANAEQAVRDRYLRTFRLTPGGQSIALDTTNDEDFINYLSRGSHSGFAMDAGKVGEFADSAGYKDPGLQEVFEPTGKVREYGKHTPGYFKSALGKADRHQKVYAEYNKILNPKAHGRSLDQALETNPGLAEEGAPAPTSFGAPEAQVPKPVGPTAGRIDISNVHVDNNNVIIPSPANEDPTVDAYGRLYEMLTSQWKRHIAPKDGVWDATEGLVSGVEGRIEKDGTIILPINQESQVAKNLLSSLGYGRTGNAPLAQKIVENTAQEAASMAPKAAKAVEKNTQFTDAELHDITNLLFARKDILKKFSLDAEQLATDGALRYEVYTRLLGKFKVSPEALHDFHNGNTESVVDSLAKYYSVSSNREMAKELKRAAGKAAGFDKYSHNEFDQGQRLVKMRGLMDTYGITPEGPDGAYTPQQIADFNWDWAHDREAITSGTLEQTDPTVAAARARDEARAKAAGKTAKRLVNNKSVQMWEKETNELGRITYRPIDAREVNGRAAEIMQQATDDPASILALRYGVSPNDGLSLVYGDSYSMIPPSDVAAFPGWAQGLPKEVRGPLRRYGLMARDDQAESWAKQGKPLIDFTDERTRIVLGDYASKKGLASVDYHEGGLPMSIVNFNMKDASDGLINRAKAQLRQDAMVDAGNVLYLGEGYKATAASARKHVESTLAAAGLPNDERTVEAIRKIASGKATHEDRFVAAAALRDTEFSHVGYIGQKDSMPVTEPIMGSLLGSEMTTAQAKLLASTELGPDFQRLLANRLAMEPKFKLEREQAAEKMGRLNALLGANSRLPADGRVANRVATRAELDAMQKKARLNTGTKKDPSTGIDVPQMLHPSNPGSFSTGTSAADTNAQQVTGHSMLAREGAQALDSTISYTPHSPWYVPAWGLRLNRGFRNDFVGRAIIDHIAENGRVASDGMSVMAADAPKEFVNRTMQAFKADPSYKEWASNPGVSIEHDWQLADFINEQWREVHKLVPDQRLAQVLQQGSAADSEIMDAAMRTGQFPIFDSREIVHKDNIFRRTVNTAFRWLGTMPEDVLVRHPYAGRQYMTYMQSMLKTHVEQTGSQSVSTAELRAYSHQAFKMAQTDTRNTLFTIARYSSRAQTLRYVMPFFAAWENSMGFWARQFIDNPFKAIVYANVFGNAPIAQNFWAVTDQDNNPVKVEGDLSKWKALVAGNYNMTLPAPSWAGGSQTIPVGSINFIMPGSSMFSAGMSPLVTIPIKRLVAHHPSLENFQSLPGFNKLPLGLRQQVYEQFVPFRQVGANAGDNNITSPFMTASAPASVTSFKRAVEGWLDPKGQHDAQFAATVTSIYLDDMATYTDRMDYWSRNGQKGPKPTQPNYNDMLEQAGKKAAGLWFMRGIEQLSLPFSARPTNRYQLLHSEWIKLSQDTQAAGGTQQDAMQKFTTLYGPGAIYYTNSLSKSTIGGAPTSQEWWKLYNANKDLASTAAHVDNSGDQSAVGMMAVGLPQGQFSPAVWAAEFSTPVTQGGQAMRVAQSDVVQRGIDTQVSAGWNEWNKINIPIEQQLKQRGLTSYNQRGAEDLKAYRQYVFDSMSKMPQYQRWVVAKQQFDQTKWFNNVKVLDALVNDPKFARTATQFPMAEARQYMQAREQVRQVLLYRARQGGSMDSGATSNQDLADYMGYVSQTLKDQSVGFGDLYDRYLSSDKFINLDTDKATQ